MDTLSEKQHFAELGDSLHDASNNLPSPRTPGNDAKTSSSSSFYHHLYTLYLFTRSDFKTVIVPQSIFALAAASRYISTIQQQQQQQQQIPPSSPFSTSEYLIRIPYMLTWLWLHLVVENVANQRLESSVLEDAVNKPWRPIPAGLITPRQSQAVLRWAVPLCLALSSLAGSSLLLPSTALMCFVWLYNDLDGSGAGPIQRSAINAAGLACFGWGALVALVSGPATVVDHGGAAAAALVLPRMVQIWIGMIAAIVFSTVHAADFPDVEGDRERGRQTMPLVYGEDVSRWVLAVAVLAWSVASLAFWHVEVGVVWVAPLLVGSFLAGLTVLRRDHGSDELAWKLWCLWIVVLFLLPLAGSV
ncbi:UbiA prenyltransferase family-domain-containing protein [Microdochium trichocladiopsis]|uniref:UbiA prenyltransferase family-domain-containing protein n=1 Tax=Microdochium trichocladiopsis TaxID=1682393 RepID=A0A9P8YFC1_9PEZI|nr:UbiA prenyltransferase family-domain-containing protein [Microdochium trichocladiopsis]KAH7038194.1 UbiA prenyltransferase family-domain-containing protein [Microdochium trichocladiopsis]